MFSSDNIVKRLANHIRMCGELACLLEVSATPKPGNVHRFRDFEDIRYEDFLASSISIGHHLEELALRGFKIKEKKISWEELKLGIIIKDAVEQSNYFHNRGNTNLGIILLLSPLAVAAGMSCDPEKQACDLDQLRNAVLEVMVKTTVDDSIHVSEGIALANPGGLGKAEKYDVTADNYSSELRNDNITLIKLMQGCEERDNICFELSRGYPISFETGYKTLTRSLIISKDINLSIIDAYLEILSQYPDTLIKRKFGNDKAEEVSNRAEGIIKLGGALTVDGRRELEEFDIELREEEEKINPGTTADIIASTIFIYLLTGGKI